MVFVSKFRLMSSFGWLYRFLYGMLAPLVWHVCTSWSALAMCDLMYRPVAVVPKGFLVVSVNMSVYIGKKLKVFASIQNIFIFVVRCRFLVRRCLEDIKVFFDLL